MKLLTFSAGLLALACAPLAHAAPMRAAAFVDSIGVGTHLTQQPAYYDARKVQGALAYLGVRHLRDAAPDPRSPYPAVFGAYAALGYDFTLTGSGYSTGAQADLQAAAFQAAHPGGIAGLEGYNEPNNWKQPSGGWYGGMANTHAAANAYARELMSAEAKIPALAGVPILNASDEPPPGPAGDVVNVHSYQKGGLAPHDTLWFDRTRYMAAAPGLPVWVTETGYYTAKGADGVGEAAQAAYTLQTLAYDAASGVQRTYLYELLDQKTGDANTELNYGLFHTDGTPKLAATYLRNLLALVADKGAKASTFTPSCPTVTFSDPAVSQLMLGKSDGGCVVLFWKNVTVWDARAGKPIVPASTSFTWKMSAVRTMTGLHLNDATTKPYGRAAGSVSPYSYSSGVSAVAISAN